MTKFILLGSQFQIISEKFRLEGFRENLFSQTKLREINHNKRRKTTTQFGTTKPIQKRRQRVTVMVFTRPKKVLRAKGLSFGNVTKVGKFAKELI